MPVLGLTKNDAASFKFIKEFIEKNGWSPSYQEIMEHLGLKSKSGVHRTIKILVERGYLVNQFGRVRSMRVAEPAEDPSPGADHAVVSTENLLRYSSIESGLLRHHALCGPSPADIQEEKVLRWLAVALVALPDDRAVAYRLRRFSVTLNNFAFEIERKEERSL